MTQDELMDAVEIKMERYGIADRAESEKLLPQAIADFVGANVWDFLIPPPRTVQTVAGRDYITMPVGYYKVLSLWKTDYKIQKTNYVKWAELKAANVLSSVKGLLYCQMGDRIYLFPQPTSVETYNFIGAVEGTNLTFGSIPQAYHSIVFEILLCLRTPESHKAFPELQKRKDKALSDAAAIANDQPDTQEPVELDGIQRRMNVLKYGTPRLWPGKIFEN